MKNRKNKKRKWLILTIEKILVKVFKVEDLKKLG